MLVEAGADSQPDDARRQNAARRAAGIETVQPSAGGYPGSAHPGPRNPARETISCRPAATSPRSSLVSPALLPRPPKSPHIQRENGGEPRRDPGVRAPTRLGGGGGSLERTRLATNLGKCPQSVESTPVPPSTMTSRSSPSARRCQRTASCRCRRAASSRAGATARPSGGWRPAGLSARDRTASAAPGRRWWKCSRRAI